MFHDYNLRGNDGPDYFGPPRPGQSFAQYESFMSLPITVGAGSALIGALLFGPIGAITVGGGAWLAASKMKKKPLMQGG